MKQRWISAVAALVLGGCASDFSRKHNVSSGVVEEFLRDGGSMTLYSQDPAPDSGTGSEGLQGGVGW